MRRKVTLLIVLAAAALGVAGSTARGTSSTYTAMTRADLTIYHSMFGCHTWALNGNENLIQHVVIRAGRSFTVGNRDNCPHKLVQTSGPQGMMTSGPTGAATDGNLAPLGKRLRVNLFTPGTYTFTTEEGALSPDTPLSGFFQMPSYGADNQLSLEVKVLPLAKMDE